MNERLERTGVLLLLAAMLLLPGLSRASDEVRREFDAASARVLVVDTDIGSIEIDTHSADVVDVRVIRSGRYEEDLEIRFETDGDRIAVYGDMERDWGSHNNGWGNGSRARFEITVPMNFDVDLETAGGSIEVADLNGEILARTSGGSLSFGRVEGTVRAKTSGGSIRFDGGNANADLRTSGGSIRVGDVGGELKVHTSGGSISIGRVDGSVDAHTSGGSISVEEAVGSVNADTSGGSVTAYISQQPVGDSRLETSGGMVTVYLADNVAVDLYATAGSGRVKSDFDLGQNRDEYDRGRALRGALNGGGPRLELHSSNGVRIRRR